MTMHYMQEQIVKDETSRSICASKFAI